MCEKSYMCVHKDLVCDGHPQCLNNEDEDFDTCKTKWIEKKVFPSHATVRCKSKTYPKIVVASTRSTHFNEMFVNC